jgi:predicted 3-demethylubiquinone-9 3-methyltransferase (glyoxalase superfamily)
MKKGITTNLWFNGNAKEAVDFYVSIFHDSKILNIDYYTDVGEEITGHKKGHIVTIVYEILGTTFIAINAGPEFAFSPSVSFMIECDTQEEIDHYWNSLSAKPEFEQCGWLQDKYGISWQIVPSILNTMMKNGTEKQRKSVTEKFMAMKKFDIAELNKAYQD